MHVYVLTTPITVNGTYTRNVAIINQSSISIFPVTEYRQYNLVNMRMVEKASRKPIPLMSCGRRTCFGMLHASSSNFASSTLCQLVSIHLSGWSLYLISLELCSSRTCTHP